ncbi:MAG: hypothetical protein M1469_08345 [Bacteroidetes bacterium]|nr:hypothetical protein [Bacteroidota bacterium]
MGDLIDIISSTLIAGMLLLAVLKVNATLTSTNSDTNVEVITQENATTIANTIAYDFYKIGYKATPAIIFADTSAVTFRAQMDHDGIVDTIHYWLGNTVSTPLVNPNWRTLYRIKDSAPTRGASLGVTSFNLGYYDSTGTEISIPAGGTSDQSILSEIKSIHVVILFQSATKVDSSYAETYWEEFISPKNLQSLM